MKRQTIFPILTMLVVAALALIGSSFAWFTISNQAKVSQITSRIQSSDVNLMLSVDAQNYYTENIDISSASQIINPGTLYQVSTNGKTTGGMFKFYNAKVKGMNANGSLILSKQDLSVTQAAGILGKNTQAFTDGNAVYGEAALATEPTYIAFDLYLSVSADAKIYLLGGAGGTAVSGDTNAVNSIRVAFVNLGTTPNTSKGLDGAAYIAAAQNDTSILKALVGDGSVAIWEPGKAALNPVTVYGLNEEETVSAFNQNTASHAEAQVTKSTAELVGENEQACRNGLVSQIADVKSGYNKVRVYIWLEGQDPDCTDSVASKDLTFDFTLYAVKSI